MNEEFLIHIDGKMEQQGEWDHVDLLTRGSLVQKGSNFFISYQESDATGYAGCTTTVKAAADSHKVTMIRFGSAASQLIIEKAPAMCATTRPATVPYPWAWLPIPSKTTLPQRGAPSPSAIRWMQTRTPYSAAIL